MVDVLFVNTFGLPVNSGIAVFALSLFALLGWSVWYTHRRGRVVWNTLLLATTMILLGYSSYATVTIRAAANPPMNSNDPSNPHALFSVLNRDQYGGRPLLYGAYYSAPVESVVESTRYYIDDEGRYATASFPTGYTHPQQFMHLFPRMWNYAKSPDEYKQWAAYRTKVETPRDEQGNVLRDERAGRQRGEVLDYGTKRTYDDGYSEPRVITEPTFLRISTTSSPTSSTTCTGAISCGTSSAARATSSPPVRRRSPTATGCRESTRSTASTWGRRRICRAKWPTTKRATPTISYPSSWASSG